MNHKILSKIILIKSCLLLLISFLSVGAWAGMGTSLMQSAQVEPVGSVELKLHNDIILNRGGGLNISPHLKTGIIDGFFDIDAYFGAGKTDFLVGSKVKFNLLPDLDGQVGVAFYGGYTFIRDDVPRGHRNFHLFSLGTVVSKAFEVSFGNIEPYGAFELEFLKSSGNTDTPISLILGSRWRFESVHTWSFYSEVGLNLNESLNVLALGASYPF